MWLYLPPSSTTSASAPAAPDLTSASSWQFQALARSAWSKGKPMPSASWLRLWKRAPWLRALCGQMPEPSGADAGVALWMGSLAASRASLIASRESEPGQRTNATSSRPSGASSCSPGRGGPSSKTSPACLAGKTGPSPAPSGSGEAFSAWAGRLRQDCSRRQKLATARNASGSSASRWPAAVAHDAQTPKTPEQIARMKATAAKRTGGGPPGVSNLNERVQNWPAPCVRDYRTPNSQDSQDRRAVQGGPQLNNFVEMWAAPTVACAMGGQISRGGDRQDELLLGGQAISVSSLLDPTISPDGANTSASDRRLNPVFVEALMGWPTAWSVCGCSATALSLWWEHMRFELLRIGLPPEAPPEQRDLFS